MGEGGERGAIEKPNVCTTVLNLWAKLSFRVIIISLSNQVTVNLQLTLIEI